MPPLRMRRMKEVLRETSSKTTHGSARDVHLAADWKTSYMPISCTGWKESREWHYLRAPCFVGYAGWLPIPLIFWRWSMSTTWAKRDNRDLCWWCSKPACPLGFLGYLWNKTKTSPMHNSSQSWCLCLNHAWTPHTSPGPKPYTEGAEQGWNAWSNLPWIRPCTGKPEILGILALREMFTLKIMSSLFTQIRVGHVCIMLISEVN